VLSYAYRLLALEYTTGLPPDLQLKESDENLFGLFITPDAYCTVLFNDESHTFEQVRKALKIGDLHCLDLCQDVYGADINKHWPGSNIILACDLYF
jgi:hypothetical protein